MWCGEGIYGSSSYLASCLLAPSVCAHNYLTQHTHCSTNVIVGTSIALLIETAKPGAVFGVKLISNFGTAFWSISVSLNVVSTILIAGMLLWHDKKLRRLGFQGSGPYIGIAAVLAESAALYSVFGLIYIPLFARNLSLQYPFSPLFISAAVRIFIISS
jgi:hypothetical protein